MLLHWSPRSPFVRKVMVVAHELGLADGIRCVRTFVAAGQPNAELMPVNPQSRLPTLELDDGTALYDSRVICEYLDGLAGGRLFPTGPARMAALRRQALGDGMLDTGIDWLTERGRPEANQSAEFIAAFRRKQLASVDILEAEDLPADLADIGVVAVAVALGYLDFRFPGLAWRESRQHLAAWYEAALARPSMQATLPSEG